MNMDQSIWVQILMSLSRIKNNFLGSDGGKNKKERSPTNLGKESIKEKRNRQMDGHGDLKK